MDCSTFADGRIMQIAYVTDDVERSARAFGGTFGIGGWAIVRNIGFASMSLRGVPCEAAISGAVAFQGDMMYEFIQPLDDRPSVYRDPVSNALLAGFHHVARLVPDLEQALPGYAALGYRTAMECRVATGARAIYVERAEAGTGMIELLEIAPPVDALIGAVEAISAARTDGNVVFTYW